MKKTALYGYILLLIIFSGFRQLYTDFRKTLLTAHYPPVIISRRSGGMQDARYGNWIVVTPAVVKLYGSHFNLYATGAYTVLVETNQRGYYRRTETGQ